jgi:hypothetical protein
MKDTMTNGEKLDKLNAIERSLIKEQAKAGEKEVKNMLQYRIDKVSQAINQLIMDSIYEDCEDLETK